jgi:PPOX class probable F420-dependent enzyme
MCQAYPTQVCSRMAESHPTPDRPNFPDTYGVDRAVRDDMVAWDEAVERLTASRNYWVSTTRPDGRPHVAPVWGLWMDDAFYFSTDPVSRKGRNITAQPEVAVHLESGDDVVILEGRAERVADQATLERMVEVYDHKYATRFDPTDPNFGVYVVRPVTAYAWFEKSFPTSATRWRFNEG